MTKGKAFALCYAAIMFIFAAMLLAGIVTRDYTHIPVASCLTALCSVTGGYIGLQVANNGVKGKCWNSELYDRENAGRGGEGRHDVTGISN